MSAKTANVVARVEPEVKEQAEAILDSLGVSASTVINMLYRQIVMTRSIPFSVSLPARPKAVDEMTDEEFDAMMEHGLAQAMADQSTPVDEAFSKLMQRVDRYAG